MKSVCKKILCFVLCALFFSFSASASGRYVAKEGDTFCKIAREKNVNYFDLRKYNPAIKRVQENDLIIVPIRVSELRSMEREVVRLVNAEREARGLSTLTVVPRITRVARLKSEDLRDNNYFAHTSPTYGSPFEMMDRFHINYRYAGENIAHGQQTAKRVVDAWMQSKGHRENILNPHYKHIGVGACEGVNGPYWTQMFTD